MSRGGGGGRPVEASLYSIAAASAAARAAGVGRWADVGGIPDADRGAWVHTTTAIAAAGAALAALAAEADAARVRR